MGASFWVSCDLDEELALVGRSYGDTASHRHLSPDFFRSTISRDSCAAAWPHVISANAAPCPAGHRTRPTAEPSRSGR